MFLVNNSFDPSLVFRGAACFLARVTGASGAPRAHWRVLCAAVVLALVAESPGPVAADDGQGESTTDVYITLSRPSNQGGSPYTAPYAVDNSGGGSTAPPPPNPAPKASDAPAPPPELVPAPQPQIIAAPEPLTVGPREEDWVRKTEMDNGLANQFLQLYDKKHEIQSDLRKNLPADAMTIAMDMWSADGTTLPRAEERHQDKIRIGEIDRQIQQLIDANGLQMAATSATIQAPDKGNAPADDQNGPYSVNVSDGTVVFRPPAPAPTPYVVFPESAQGTSSDSMPSVAPSSSTQSSSPGSSNLGGIDFSSVELKYLAEVPAGTSAAVAYAFKARGTANGGITIPVGAATKAASDSFFVWLALDPNAF